MFAARFRGERPVYGLRGVSLRPEGNRGRWRTMTDLGEDLVQEIRRRFPDETCIMAGYSFGAWVNALTTITEPSLTNMIMVSPPLAFLDFGAVSDLNSLRLIVTGSRDDIAPPELIKTSYHGWNAEAQFEVISGADHFYVGYTDKLEALLTAYLERRESGVLY